MQREVQGPRRSRRWVAETVLAAGGSIDAWRFVAASWWLALVAIAVLQQAHEGLHEHLELPPLLHLLRDGALAVPAAAIAVLVGTIALLIIGLDSTRPRARRALVALAWVALTAGVFAVLSIPGNQLHGALFGAEEEEELSFLADALLDGSLAFLGALLALVPMALVIGPPVVRPIDPSIPEPPRRLRPAISDVSARSSK